MHIILFDCQIINKLNIIIAIKSIPEEGLLLEQAIAVSVVPDPLGPVVAQAHPRGRQGLEGKKRVKKRIQAENFACKNTIPI